MLKRRKLEFDFVWLRSWFALEPGETRLLAGVLVIVLIGLTARHLHLRGERPEAIPTPAGALENGASP